MTHGSLEKNLPDIYNHEKKTDKSLSSMITIQWLKDVQHFIATIHTLSVQIWKYSSLRFGCFLRMSCAGCFCIKGFVIVFFCIFIVTVVNGVSKVSKRSKSGNL